MKNTLIKKIIAISMFLLISIFSLIGIFLIIDDVKAFENTNDENELLKRELKTSNEIIQYLEKEIEKQNLIIEIAYNSAVQFEMLVGVKNPNGIVTYKEKCLITAKQMNKIKNYKP